MAHPEKMGDPTPVRLPETLEKQAKAFCAAHDIAFSEWVRNLMVEALAAEEKKYNLLHSIFGQSRE